MTTPHPPQTHPDAAAGDGLDDILDELVFEITPEDAGKQGEIRHLRNGVNQKAKTALKAWAYAEALPILNDMKTESQPFDTESMEKSRTVWNSRIDSAAANLKRRLGAEEAQ